MTAASDAKRRETLIALLRRSTFENWPHSRVADEIDKLYRRARTAKPKG